MERISVEEDLGDEGALGIEAFNPVRGQVLSLLQFEDVFFSVDDLKAVSLGVELGNISRL